MDLQPVFLALSLGLLASTSPCILPLYPGFLAYLAGNQEQLAGRKAGYVTGLFVLAGVQTVMLGVGLALSLVAVSLGRVLAYAVPIADLLILALGGLLVFNVNPFEHLPRVRVPALAHPWVSAYVYGLLYGPLTLPCSGPLAISIFAYSFTIGEFFGKLWVFLWYGAGLGLPLLGLSLLSGAAQRWLTRLVARRARLINLAAGLLLIGIGVADLFTNRELLAQVLLGV